MPVGSIQRTQSPEVSLPPAPPEAAGAPPIDVSRDYVEPAPARVAARPAESAQAAGAASPAGEAYSSPYSRAAAHAFVQGGVGGLDTYLRTHRQEARWLMSISRESLASELRTALQSEPGYRDFMGPVRAFVDANAMETHMAESIQGDLREMVRSRAVDHIDQMRRGLEGSTPEQLTARLRAAPPGSPEAVVAREMGVRGNEMDVERVETWRERALGQLAELRDTVMGQAWSPEELPGTTAGVQADLGLRACARNSIAGEVFFRQSHDADATAHRAEAAAGALEATHASVELAAAVVELSHAAAHGGAAVAVAETAAMSAAVGVAVPLAGLAFGVALHHAIEERRADRREVAESLGL